jgi:hypothetical protein
MKQAMVDRIDAAIVAGRLTQAQASALKARVQSGAALPFAVGPGFRGGFGMHRGFGFGFGFGHGLRSGGSAVTQYLGISAATLRSELVSGKSLAQVASAIPGKSVGGLENAITAAARTKLDQAVKDGRITASPAPGC